MLHLQMWTGTDSEDQDAGWLILRSRSRLSPECSSHNIRGVFLENCVLVKRKQKHQTAVCAIFKFIMHICICGGVGRDVHVSAAA